MCSSICRAGPEPESIEDGPEATEVLEEVCSRYLDLPPDQQDDIAIVSLPMASAKENALLVFTQVRRWIELVADSVSS